MILDNQLNVSAPHRIYDIILDKLLIGRMLLPKSLYYRY